MVQNSNLMLTIDNDESVVGYQIQTEWKGLIAAAFFLGKIGAGTFLVSLLADISIGVLAGLIVAGVGKGAAHLIYLGHPLRCWKMFLRPQTSWISRGLLAMVVFIISGLLYWAGMVGFFSLVPGSVLVVILKVLAISSSLVIMLYDGFVLAASPAIPLWHTSLMPILCLSYSLLGGTTTSLLLLKLVNIELPSEGILELLNLLLLIWTALAVLTYIWGMFNARPAAKLAMGQLLQGRNAWMFVGLAIFVGLGLSIVLAVFAYVTGSQMLIYLISITDLVGHFFIFWSLLITGIYNPVSSIH